MRRGGPFSKNLLFFAALFTAGAVFLADFSIPLGYSIWLLYFIPLLMASRVRRLSAIIAMAVIIPVFITLPFFKHITAVPKNIALFNRLLADLVMISSAFFLFRARSLEEQIRQKQMDYREVVENSSNIIIKWDERGMVTFVNTPGLQHLGYARDEIIGGNAADIIPEIESTGRRAKELFAAMIAEKRKYPAMEIETITKAGKRIWVAWVISIILDPDGRFKEGLAVGNDITPLKESHYRLARAVREAKRRADEAEDGERTLDALFENIPEGVTIIDAEGKVRRVSRYLTRTFGIDAKEILGRYFKALDEKYMEPAGFSAPRKADTAGAEGTSRPATAVQERSGASLYPLERALTNGEVTVSEERSIYLPNGAVMTAVINAAPIRDPDGGIAGAVTSWRDITERKKAEEAILASNLELEQFAYVASHDLQEPLRVVASFTDLLKNRYQNVLDERGRKYMDYIVDGAARLQNLIQDLLAFSRVGRSTERYPVDCNAVMEDVIRSLSESIKRTMAVVTYTVLPVLTANRTDIERLFLNLIGNALKFRKEEAPPRVKVTARREDGRWLFSVSDNGIGIEPRFFKKIFVVFQRLHSRDKYQGTGIGLAICKKIVESYGGKMWVESQPGEGTTFFFTMPRTE